MYEGQSVVWGLHAGMKRVLKGRLATAVILFGCIFNKLRCSSISKNALLQMLGSSIL